MTLPYISDQSFTKIDVDLNPLVKAEYENCIFNSCDFSEINFAEFRFVKCQFVRCNLSMVRLYKTSFQEISFIDSKLLGIRFDNCNQLGLSFTFENCLLNYSSFQQTKIRKTIFRNCQMHELDFTESVLVQTVFDNCDLMRTQFHNCNMEYADFRTSYHFSIDPEVNRMKNAKFSVSGLAGLLGKYEIEID
jgi:fluoroquinolone resistance protein